jgi:hypothetical protein
MLTSCTSTSEVGLHIVAPPLVQKTLAIYPEVALVDSVQPILEWDPLEVDHDLLGSHRLDQVTYEVRVWSTVPLGTSKVVYRREELISTRHQLEEPLEAGCVYIWSVRPHFRLDRGNRVGRWSMVGRVLETETVPNDSCPRLKTPDAPADSGSGSDLIRSECAPAW